MTSPIGDRTLKIVSEIKNRHAYSLDYGGGLFRYGQRLAYNEKGKTPKLVDGYLPIRHRLNDPSKNQYHYMLPGKGGVIQFKDDFNNQSTEAGNLFGLYDDDLVEIEVRMDNSYFAPSNYTSHPIYIQADCSNTCEGRCKNKRWVTTGFGIDVLYDCGYDNDWKKDEGVDGSFVDKVRGNNHTVMWKWSPNYDDSSSDITLFQPALNGSIVPTANEIQSIDDMRNARINDGKLIKGLTQGVQTGWGDRLNFSNPDLGDAKYFIRESNGLVDGKHNGLHIAHNNMNSNGVPHYTNVTKFRVRAGDLRGKSLRVDFSAEVHPESGNISFESPSKELFVEFELRNVSVIIRKPWRMCDPGYFTALTAEQRLQMVKKPEFARYMGGTGGNGLPAPKVSQRHYDAFMQLLCSDRVPKGPQWNLRRVEREGEWTHMESDVDERANNGVAVGDRCRLWAMSGVIDTSKGYEGMRKPLLSSDGQSWRPDTSGWSSVISQEMERQEKNVLSEWSWQEGTTLRGMALGEMDAAGGAENKMWDGSKNPIVTSPRGGILADFCHTPVNRTDRTIVSFGEIRANRPKMATGTAFMVFGRPAGSGPAVKEAYYFPLFEDAKEAAKFAATGANPKTERFALDVAGGEGLLFFMPAGLPEDKRAIAVESSPDETAQSKYPLYVTPKVGDGVPSLVDPSNERRMTLVSYNLPQRGSTAPVAQLQQDWPMLKKMGDNASVKMFKLDGAMQGVTDITRKSAYFKATLDRKPLSAISYTGTQEEVLEIMSVPDIPVDVSRYHGASKLTVRIRVKHETRVLGLSGVMNGQTIRIEPTFTDGARGVPVQINGGKSMRLERAYQARYVNILPPMRRSGDEMVIDLGSLDAASRQPIDLSGNAHHTVITLKIKTVKNYDTLAVFGLVPETKVRVEVEGTHVWNFKANGVAVTPANGQNGSLDWITLPPTSSPEINLGALSANSQPIRHTLAVEMRQFHALNFRMSVETNYLTASLQGLRPGQTYRIKVPRSDGQRTWNLALNGHYVTPFSGVRGTYASVVPHPTSLPLLADVPVSDWQQPIGQMQGYKVLKGNALKGLVDDPRMTGPFGAQAVGQVGTPDMNPQEALRLAISTARIMRVKSFVWFTAHASNGLLAQWSVGLGSMPPAEIEWRASVNRGQHAFTVLVDKWQDDAAPQYLASWGGLQGVHSMVQASIRVHNDVRLGPISRVGYRTDLSQFAPLTGGVLLNLHLDVDVADKELRLEGLGSRQKLRLHITNTAGHAWRARANGLPFGSEATLTTSGVVDVTSPDTSPVRLRLTDNNVSWEMPSELHASDRTVQIEVTIESNANLSYLMLTNIPRGRNIKITSKPTTRQLNLSINGAAFGEIAGTRTVSLPSHAQLWELAPKTVCGGMIGAAAAYYKSYGSRRHPHWDTASANDLPELLPQDRPDTCGKTGVPFAVWSLPGLCTPKLAYQPVTENQAPFATMRTAYGSTMDVYWDGVHAGFHPDDVTVLDWRQPGRRFVVDTGALKARVLLVGTPGTLGRITGVKRLHVSYFNATAPSVEGIAASSLTVSMARGDGTPEFGRVIRAAWTQINGSVSFDQDTAAPQKVDPPGKDLSRMQQAVVSIGAPMDGLYPSAPGSGQRMLGRFPTLQDAHEWASSHNVSKFVWAAPWLRTDWRGVEGLKFSAWSVPESKGHKFGEAGTALTSAQLRDMAIPNTARYGFATVDLANAAVPTVNVPGTKKDRPTDLPFLLLLQVKGIRAGEPVQFRVFKAPDNDAQADRAHVNFDRPVAMPNEGFILFNFSNGVWTVSKHAFNARGEHVPQGIQGLNWQGGLGTFFLFPPLTDIAPVSGESFFAKFDNQSGTATGDVIQATGMQLTGNSPSDFISQCEEAEAALTSMPARAMPEFMARRLAGGQRAKRPSNFTWGDLCDAYFGGPLQPPVWALNEKLVNANKRKGVANDFKDKPKRGGIIGSGNFLVSSDGFSEGGRDLTNIRFATWLRDTANIRFESFSTPQLRLMEQVMVPQILRHYRDASTQAEGRPDTERYREHSLFDMYSKLMAELCSRTSGVGLIQNSLGQTVVPGETEMHALTDTASRCRLWAFPQSNAANVFRDTLQAGFPQYAILDIAKDNHSTNKRVLNTTGEGSTSVSIMRAVERFCMLNVPKNARLRPRQRTDMPYMFSADNKRASILGLAKPTAQSVFNACSDWIGAPGRTPMFHSSDEISQQVKNMISSTINDLTGFCRSPVEVRDSTGRVIDENICPVVLRPGITQRGYCGRHPHSLACRCIHRWAPGRTWSADFAFAQRNRPSAGSDVGMDTSDVRSFWGPCSDSSEFKDHSALAPAGKTWWEQKPIVVCNQIVKANVSGGSQFNNLNITQDVSGCGSGGGVPGSGSQRSLFTPPRTTHGTCPDGWVLRNVWQNRAEKAKPHKRALRQVCDNLCTVVELLDPFGQRIPKHSWKLLPRDDTMPEDAPPRVEVTVNEVQDPQMPSETTPVTRVHTLGDGEGAWRLRRPVNMGDVAGEADGLKVSPAPVHALGTVASSMGTVPIPKEHKRVTATYTAVGTPAQPAVITLPKPNTTRSASVRHILILTLTKATHVVFKSASGILVHGSSPVGVSGQPNNVLPVKMQLHYDGASLEWSIAKHALDATGTRQAYPTGLSIPVSASLTEWDDSYIVETPLRRLVDMRDYTKAEVQGERDRGVAWENKALLLTAGFMAPIGPSAAPYRLLDAGIEDIFLDNPAEGDAMMRCNVQPTQDYVMGNEEQRAAFDSLSNLQAELDRKYIGMMAGRRQKFSAAYTALGTLKDSLATYKEVAQNCYSALTRCDDDARYGQGETKLKQACRAGMFGAAIKALEDLRKAVGDSTQQARARRNLVPLFTIRPILNGTAVWTDAMLANIRASRDVRGLHSFWGGEADSKKGEATAAFDASKARKAGLVASNGFGDRGFWPDNIMRHVLVDTTPPAGKTDQTPFARGRVGDATSDVDLYFLEVASESCGNEPCSEQTLSSSAPVTAHSAINQACCQYEVAATTAPTNNDRALALQRYREIQRLGQDVLALKDLVENKFNSLKDIMQGALDARADVVRGEYNRAIDDAVITQTKIMRLEPSQTTLLATSANVFAENERAAAFQSGEMRKMRDQYAAIGKEQAWQSLWDATYSCEGSAERRAHPTRPACRLAIASINVSNKAATLFINIATSKVSSMEAIEGDLKSAVDSVKANTTSAGMSLDAFRNFISTKYSTFMANKADVSSAVAKCPDGESKTGLSSRLDAVQSKVTAHWTYLSANLSNIRVVDVPLNDNEVDDLIEAINGRVTSAQTSLAKLKTTVQGITMRTSLSLAEVRLATAGFHKANIESSATVPADIRSRVGRVSANHIKKSTVDSALSSLGEQLTNANTSFSAAEVIVKRLRNIDSVGLATLTSLEAQRDALNAKLQTLITLARQQASDRSKEADVTKKMQKDIEDRLQKVRLEIIAREKLAQENAAKKKPKAPTPAPVSKSPFDGMSDSTKYAAAAAVGGVLLLGGLGIALMSGGKKQPANAAYPYGPYPPPQYPYPYPPQPQRQSVKRRRAAPKVKK